MIILPRPLWLFAAAVKLLQDLSSGLFKPGEFVEIFGRLLDDMNRLGRESDE